MLGKLLKYEAKGFSLPALIMMLVSAGTTVLTIGVILTINPKYDETITGYSIIALILSVFLYYFGIIGCSLGTMLIIAIRFYKTCYTDQGYLTHTLPVSTKQILNAKIIASTVLYLLMVLTIAASLYIIIQVGIHHVLSFVPGEYSEIRREFTREFSAFIYDFEDELGISFGLYMTYIIVYSLISLLANIVTVLGCVSLGQLYAKHRIVGAIAAYFIVQFAMQLIGSVCSIPMYSRMLIADDFGRDTTPFGIVSPTLNLMLLLTVAVAVAMYFVNLHMMTKKLNLE